MASTSAESEPRATGITGAGRRWNVSTDSIRRLIEDGTLPAYRTGPRSNYRILVEDLDRVFKPVADPADRLTLAIEQAVADAPPLTADQKDRVRALLTPVLGQVGA